VTFISFDIMAWSDVMTSTVRLAGYTKTTRAPLFQIFTSSSNLPVHPPKIHRLLRTVTGRIC